MNLAIEHAYGLEFMANADITDWWKSSMVQSIHQRAGRHLLPAFYIQPAPLPFMENP